MSGTFASAVYPLSGHRSSISTAYLGTEVRSREIRKLAVGYLERRLHVLCYLVIPVAVPLPKEVVEKMQATGEGWELRVEEAVRQWLARQGKRRRVAS